MTKKEREIKEKEQNGKCFYCGLKGDVRKNYKQQLKEIGKTYFKERVEEGEKKGGRGKCLELERKKPKDPYSEDNCVFACYPCNNAKSDVFTDKEFIFIGAVIRALKTKRKKLKNNKFIQGLINDITKATGRKI